MPAPAAAPTHTPSPAPSRACRVFRGWVTQKVEQLLGMPEPTLVGYIMTLLQVCVSGGGRGGKDGECCSPLVRIKHLLSHTLTPVAGSILCLRTALLAPSRLLVLVHLPTHTNPSQGRAAPSKLAEELGPVLDSDTDTFVIKLYRMVIYETEKAAAGL